MNLIRRKDSTVVAPTGNDPGIAQPVGFERHWLCADLGQQQDPTAVIVIKDYQYPQGRVLGPRMRVVAYADHFLGYSYPDIVNHLLKLKASKLLRTACELVIDATGLGRVISDMLTEQRVPHIAIQSVVGQNWSRKGKYVNVGKNLLIENLATLFQTGELTIAEQLPLKDDLLRELETFRLEETRGGNQIIVQGKRGNHHGDLAIATACGAFASQYLMPGVIGSFRMKGYY